MSDKLTKRLTEDDTAAFVKAGLGPFFMRGDRVKSTTTGDTGMVRSVYKNDRGYFVDTLFDDGTVVQVPGELLVMESKSKLSEKEAEFRGHLAGTEDWTPADQKEAYDAYVGMGKFASQTPQARTRAIELIRRRYDGMMRSTPDGDIREAESSPKNTWWGGNGKKFHYHDQRGIPVCGSGWFGTGHAEENPDNKCSRCAALHESKLKEDVGDTIFQQLKAFGGPFGLLGFIGANGFVKGSNFLMFRVKGRNVMSGGKIKIILDPSDTYTVELWKLDRKADLGATKLDSMSDVYVDSLADVIKRMVG